MKKKNGGPVYNNQERKTIIFAIVKVWEIFKELKSFGKKCMSNQKEIKKSLYFFSWLLKKAKNF